MIKAAQDGDTEKIGNSLEKGADLNVRDDLNRTPLMIAATFGHSEVVQFLVDKGANHSDQSHYIEVAQGAIFMEQNMMPCPFTGPKMFWAGPNCLCQTKNLFTNCGIHKHFVPDKKMICIQ